MIQLHEPAPQGFALQFWDAQKLLNSSLVVAIIGMFVGPKGATVREGAAFAQDLNI